MTLIQKIAAGAGVGALLLASQFYGDWSSRSRADARAQELENQLRSMQEADAARIAELALELDLVQNRVGVTATDIKKAQDQAAAARQEQARAAAALRRTLDEQGREVETLREESGQKIAEVRDEATSKISFVNDEVTTVKTDLGAVRRETVSQFGVVNNEVGAVKTDLSATRTDLNATRTDLASSRKEMADMRDALGRQIAHNSDELAVLKRKGERDYFEFDIKKVKTLERIAGIQLQLNKADTKAKKYDMTLQIDDDKIQKKGQLVNEPVQFYVGKQRIRYELVVNAIDKDRVRGYLSKPKDAAGDGPIALK